MKVEASKKNKMNDSVCLMYNEGSDKKPDESINTKLLMHLLKEKCVVEAR